MLCHGGQTKQRCDLHSEGLCKSVRGMRGDKDVNKQMKSKKQQGKEVTPTYSLPSEEDKGGRELVAGNRQGRLHRRSSSSGKA